MKRIARVTSVAGLLIAAATATATAQAQHRVEVTAGVAYTLTAAQFEIDSDLGFNAGLNVRLGKRFFLGAQYEVYSTSDDLGRNGAVDLTFYGLYGTWYLNDDEKFTLLGVIGAGIGELEFSDSLPPDPLLLDSTDISLWYEGGLGVQFTAGQRWLFRLKLSGRRVEPENPSILLATSQTLIVPSFQVGIKF